MMQKNDQMPSLTQVSDGDLLKRYKALTLSCLFGVMVSIGVFISFISAGQEDAKKEFLYDSKVLMTQMRDEWHEMTLSFKHLRNFFEASSHVDARAFSVFTESFLQRDFVAIFALAAGGASSDPYIQTKDVPREALVQWLVQGAGKALLAPLSIENHRDVVFYDTSFGHHALLLKYVTDASGNAYYLGGLFDYEKRLAAYANLYPYSIALSEQQVGESSPIILMHNQEMMWEEAIAQSPDHLFSATHAYKLNVWDRTLVLELGLDALEGIGIGTEAWIALGLGLLLTAAIGAFLFVLIGRNMRISLSADQLRQSQDYLSLILNAVGEGIMSISKDAKVTYANDAALRLLRYEKNDDISRLSVKSLIKVEPGSTFNQHACGITKALLSGSAVNNDHDVFLDKHGNELVVEYTGTPVMDAEGQVNGIVLIFRDIKSRLEAEKERDRYMLELERSNQDLNDFAYIASHDLKEPLRGLHNHAAFLLEDYEDTLDEHGVKSLKRFTFLTAKMETLINDLLYFSRLGRQELALQTTRIADVVYEVQELLESYMEGKHVVISVQPDIPVLVSDKVRVTELFRNLITNAIKYNDKDEKTVHIGFELSRHYQGKDYTDVYFVRDNGVGIEEEHFSDVFRIFKRLEKDHGDGGTGSGLTFVKKIVERHGGEIWIESEVGVGTTIYFTLAKESYHGEASISRAA